MKSLTTLAGLILCLPALASADLLDQIEDLQPVNAWISSLEMSNECGASGCGDVCTSTSVCDPRIPMMMGDGGLGVPTSLLIQYQNHLTKVSENNSVIPQNRVGFSWNMLNDVETRSGFGGLIPGDDRDLDEFKLRLEKTFMNGDASIDLILPFNATTDSSNLFILGPGTPAINENLELGNIAVNLKFLLHQSERMSFSAGLLTEIPTQDDLETGIGIDQLFIAQIEAERESWYLTPWMGLLYEPNDKMFIQSFASYRMNTSKNDVNAFVAVNGPGVIVDGRIGSSEIPDYFMLDTQFGYRLYNNPSGRLVTGITPALELHYTSSTDTDPTASFQSNAIPISIPPSIGSVDYLTLTLATNIELGRKASLGMGFGLPLREGNSTLPLLASGPTDKNFDWSFNMNFNYYFGN